MHNKALGSAYQRLRIDSVEPHCSVQYTVYLRMRTRGRVRIARAANLASPGMVHGGGLRYSTPRPPCQAERHASDLLMQMVGLHHEIQDLKSANTGMGHKLSSLQVRRPPLKDDRQLSTRSGRTRFHVPSAYGGYDKGCRPHSWLGL
jgi:hypothetical protein